MRNIFCKQRHFSAIRQDKFRATRFSFVPQTGDKCPWQLQSVWEKTRKSKCLPGKLHTANAYSIHQTTEFRTISISHLVFLRETANSSEKFHHMWITQWNIQRFTSIFIKLANFPNSNGILIQTASLLFWCTTWNNQGKTGKTHIKIPKWYKIKLIFFWKHTYHVFEYWNFPLNFRFAHPSTLFFFNLKYFRKQTLSS